MKKLFFFIATISICFGIHAQHQINSILDKQKTYAKFVILEAIIDGNDVTDAYLENEAFLVIYESANGRLSLANVWNESQSYGSISSLNHEYIRETSNNYETDLFTFRWSYANTYDNKKGSCLVELLKIYKKAGIAFELRMVTGDMSVMIYKGFMEGTLNLEQYLN